MKRFLYIEQDVNNALQIQVFALEADAISYAKSRLGEAVKTLLGEEYEIPTKHIDQEGFIDHFDRKVEICSSECGWYVYDGVCDTMRGYIEEINIDVEDPAGAMQP